MFKNNVLLFVLAGGAALAALSPLATAQNYPIRDFAPLSMLTTAPLVLVVHPALPVNNVKELIARLNTEIVRALQQPDVKEKLAAEGSDIVGNAPGAFAAFLKADLEKWGKVVRTAGIKAG